MALPRPAPRLVAVALAGASLALAALGFAASLTFDGRSLGMGDDTIPRCTTAGLGVVQNLSGTNVVSVAVSGLPSGCGGATLQVSVNNLVTSSGGSAAVPAGGGSVTVSLAAAVAITAVEQVDLVLTGP